ncbi:AraC family transcriptional regulator [Chryseobacterium indologenes]|uniref:HTH araC/xylS-type domain-containing protein n=1 Tax=Chryseobacterium indologenes TaxID=253 RepID=A0A0N0IY55_CHRID|nr:AraC family transcriptional regulator [Chryseobacterium indologenes]KPE52851.1 hypothetical protein AOB46_02330 [Chryseobacterium indologenes]
MNAQAHSFPLIRTGIDLVYLHIAVSKRIGLIRTFHFQEPYRNLNGLSGCYKSQPGEPGILSASYMRILFLENSKISYLAEKSGFSTREVFTVTFKKETGISPSHFIKELKNPKNT